MESLAQQLNDVTRIYTKFEENVAKRFEAFLAKADEMIANNDAEQTLNPKGKRAKHTMATIADDEEPEHFESGDSSMDTSQRPHRSARNKNATSYKEPPLNTKVRRPSPLKNIKTERISSEGKENTAPNNNSPVVLSDSDDGARQKTRLARIDSQKRKSKDEDSNADANEGAKKVKLSEVDVVEVIESPVEAPVVISDDEAEKMPPPTMPPPKARGRPRTRKASRQEEEAKVEEKRGTRTRIKQERPSAVVSETVSDTSSDQTTRSTRTKSKKKDKTVPLPIPMTEVKHEKSSLDNQQANTTGKSSSVASDASVYEDAQTGPSKVPSTMPVTPLDSTYTKPDTPNSTGNATFNVASNVVGNQTFQVQSPQDVNGTYTVPSVPTPNAHDSIMTEDRSDDEATIQPTKSVAGLHKIQSAPNMQINEKSIPSSKKYEIFNPNIPSPIKAKVQAFEKFNAASGSNRFMSPNNHQLPRHMNTPGALKLATPLSLPKIPVMRPLSAQTTPLLHTNSAPVANKAASASKLAHVQKKVGAKTSTTSSASSRDPSVEDLKRTTAAIAEKKKAREEKQRLAQLQREQMEKERRQRAQMLQKEKDEKHRKLLQEKEEKKRELMNQKKLEEHIRNQKIMEQKRRELAEKEAIEAAKAKHNESLQRKVLQSQHNKNKKSKHDFETLDTDDSTDDEGKMNKNRMPPPMWSKGSLRRQAIREQTFLNSKIVDLFFSSQPSTPDLKLIFPNIEPKKLKRNSSAVWRTPPRYSEMPKY